MSALATAAEQPGPQSAYNALPGIRWSRLKRMAISPLHYATPSAYTSPAMSLGSIVHALLLGTPEVAVYDGAVRRGKAWEAFVDEHADGLIATADEKLRAERIAAAVRARPDLARLSSPELYREHAVEWTDAATGLRCKAQLDAYDAGAGVYYEIKTARDVGERGFGVAAHRLDYPGQCAFYMRGVVASGLAAERPACLLVAVENSDDACDVAVYDVPEPLLRAADERIGRLLERVAECTASGVWPGQCPERRALWVPEWADESVEAVTGLEGGD